MNIERGNVQNHFVVSSVLVCLYVLINVPRLILGTLIVRVPRHWDTEGPSLARVIRYCPFIA